MAKYPVQFELPHRGLPFLKYYSEHNVYHPGYDLNSGEGNDDLGNQIVFPFRGEVLHIATYGEHNGGFGNFIISYHPEVDLYMRFAHIQTYAKAFEAMEPVSEGEPVGTVGKTGSAKYAHLHFEVFNKAMFEIQKRNNFTFYPSGKSREWVTRYYIDGLVLIEKFMLEEKAETALAWCKKHLPESDWSDATENEAARFRALAMRTKTWFI